MKNTYKIFGTAAIVGLFLLCSIATTSSAAVGAMGKISVQAGAEELTMIKVQDSEEVDFDDAKIPIPGFPGETLPYDNDPEITPLFDNGDLATTFGFRVITRQLQKEGHLYIRVRNVGTSTSPGGDIQVTIRDCIAGIPAGLVYDGDWKEIPTTTAGRARSFVVPPLLAGPISMDEPLYYFRAQIDADAPEGLIRGHNVRHGYFIGALLGGQQVLEAVSQQSLPLQ